jgi:hypothetical protein
MNFYRQSIVLFGIVLPILILGLLLGGCFLLKEKMAASFATNQGLFKNHEVSRLKALELETKVVNQRGNLESWNELLAREAASAVNTQLTASAETLPSKEYQKAGFNRTAGTGGLGAATAQRSSQISIDFRGTFRTMQRAFLELESRLPQLQLQELRIAPNTSQQGQSPLLNIQVTYTAWEN